MTNVRPWLAYSTAGLLALLLSAAHLEAAEPQQPSTVASAQSVSGDAAGLIDQYCVRCHNTQRNTGAVALCAACLQ